MSHVKKFGLMIALLVFLPATLYAQATPWFTQPYQYRDADGAGTLTFAPLSANSTRLSFQPLVVTLLQNGVTTGGSGVYHSFPDDLANLPTAALVAFTLPTQRGQTFFFEGTLSGSSSTTGRTAALGGYAINGTYWVVSSPQTTFQWSASTTPPGPNPVINSSPALISYWAPQSFSEAMGGTYYSTFNTFQTPDSTATWSGNLSVAGRYQVEAFIPRQFTAGSVPRTTHAVYTIGLPTATTGTTAPTTSAPPAPAISQQVSVSQWMSLGTFYFGQTYQITLTDTTGEQAQTRSVVANATRLSYVGP